MKRVLFLSQWFEPEPVYKGARFVKGLQELGYEVEVLTGFPNYPTGKLYPGYQGKKLFMRETIDGVKVNRVWLYASHDRSGLKRLFNYFSFCFSAMFIGVFLIRKPHLVYVYHPPPTTGLAGIFLKIVFRSKIVYEIQDLWPDTLESTGMIKGRKILRAVSLLCSFIYRSVDKIIVSSPGFKKNLIGRGVPPAKIELIYNWYPNEEWIPQVDQNRDDSEENNEFSVLFAGTQGLAQDLDTVLDASKILLGTNPSIRIKFLGDGVQTEYLKARVKKESLTNVTFLDRVSPVEALKLLKKASVLLVTLRDDPLFKITIPSKLQAYMAVGRPIICGVGGDADELILSSGGGFTCTPSNPQSLAETILKASVLGSVALQKISERGMNFYRARLSFQIGMKRTQEIISSLRF